MLAIHSCQYPNNDMQCNRSWLVISNSFFLPPTGCGFPRLSTDIFMVTNLHLLSLCTDCTNLNKLLHWDPPFYCRNSKIQSLFILQKVIFLHFIHVRPPFIYLLQSLSPWIQFIFCHFLKPYYSQSYISFSLPVIPEY